MKFSQLMHQVYQDARLDDALAQLYNKTSVQGCISISIDPIEYLLMSTNASGWDSCQKIYTQNCGAKSFGAHTSGIFSYMCDDASIIAFRHKKEETDVKIASSKIKAHSKSWRQMVFLNIDDTTFICSRQYPSDNISAEKTVREMLEKMLADKFNLKHIWKTSRKKERVKRVITNERLDDKSPLHYNDVLAGYSCTLVYNKESNNIEETLIKVGSFPKCPICGENTIFSQPYPYCSACKSRI